MTLLLAIWTAVAIVALGAAIEWWQYRRDVERIREEDYAACDSFAGWDEPEVEVEWPEERAA